MDRALLWLPGQGAHAVDLHGVLRRRLGLRRFARDRRPNARGRDCNGLRGDGLRLALLARDAADPAPGHQGRQHPALYLRRRGRQAVRPRRVGISRFAHKALYSHRHAAVDVARAHRVGSLRRLYRHLVARHHTARDGRAQSSSPRGARPAASAASSPPRPHSHLPPAERAPPRTPHPPPSTRCASDSVQ